jgi:hypothetical protein
MPARDTAAGGEPRKCEAVEDGATIAAPVAQRTTSETTTIRDTNAFGGAIRTRSCASFESSLRSVATIAPSASAAARKWTKTSARWSMQRTQSAAAHGRRRRRAKM